MRQAAPGTNVVGAVGAAGDAAPALVSAVVLRRIGTIGSEAHEDDGTGLDPHHLRWPAGSSGLSG